MGLYQTLMNQAVKAKRLISGYAGQTAYSEYLERIQYKSPEELRALQAFCLCELLQHAVDNIPYYKKYKGKFSLTPETVFEDIRQFPIITKEILNENNQELTAPGFEITGKIKSSGTLGEKSAVLTDKYTETHSPDEFFNKKIGMVPGKGRIILKSPVKNNFKKHGNVEYEFSNIARKYFINWKQMDDETYEFIARTWHRKKPKIIWGITQAICQVAKYMESNDIKVSSPELVLVGGQTLLPQWKETIEKNWNTKVYDRYGSVEAGNAANQCMERKGYHYVPTVHFIEVLDENLNPVAEGETGGIYITTLSKRAMPMIRYKQDDLVVFTGETCPCGCNFPILKDIIGKRREGIVSPTNTIIFLVVVNEIITKSGKVSDYQVIQTDNDRLLINIALDNETGESVLTKIREDICRALNYNMNISFKKVNFIKPLPNGKMLRIVPADIYNKWRIDIEDTI